MELLDLFESQMDSLVAEVQSLRKEVEKLREEAAGLTTLTEENTYLKQTLEEEQQMKDAVLKRVDGWLSRIQDITSSTQ
jgi:regulator of replication initiation timing